MKLIGKIITKFLDFLEEANLTIASVFLGLITVLMAFEIISRKLLRSPIMYPDPFVMIMMGWSVFLLIGEVARKDEHIRIGFFAPRILGKRAPAITHALESIVALGLCIYFGYSGIRWIKFSMMMGTTQIISPNGDTYPGWIPYFIVPAGYFMAGAFYLERIVKQIASIYRQGKGEKGAESLLPKGESADTDTLKVM